MTIFAQRFNHALDLRGMTAAELSRKTGIDEGTISNYRKGKYMPKSDKLYLICDALNVRASWLFGYDVNPQESDAAITDLFEQLTTQQQEQVLDYIRFLIANQK